MTKEIQINSIGTISEKYASHPVIRALLQLLPWWGPTDTLLQHRAAEVQSLKLHAFFDELAQGEKELTDDVVRSHQFLHCYFSTLSAALHSRRKEKVEMFARLLLNEGAIQNENDEDRYEEYLNTLDQLTTISIRILSAASAEKKEYLMDVWEKGPFINDIFPETPDQIIHNSFTGLIDKGLISRPYRSTYLHNLKIPREAVTLTDFGKMFLSTITKTGKEDGH